MCLTSIFNFNDGGEASLILSFKLSYLKRNNTLSCFQIYYQQDCFMINLSNSLVGVKSSSWYRIQCYILFSGWVIEIDRVPPTTLTIFFIGFPHKSGFPTSGSYKSGNEGKLWEWRMSTYITSLPFGSFFCLDNFTFLLYCRIDKINEEQL